MTYTDKEYKFVQINNEGIDLKILSEPVIIFRRAYIPCLEVEKIDTSEKFYLAMSARSTGRALNEIFESYNYFKGLKIHAKKEGPNITDPITIALRGKI
tara:strand:- start:271 stop:567 length:297 start_codon:yes stop_codon:yes gene_type:complete